MCALFCIKIVPVVATIMFCLQYFIYKIPKQMNLKEDLLMLSVRILFFFPLFYHQFHFCIFSPRNYLRAARELLFTYLGEYQPDEQISCQLNTETTLAELKMICMAMKNVSLFCHRLSFRKKRKNFAFTAPFKC